MRSFLFAGLLVSLAAPAFAAAPIKVSLLTGKAEVKSSPEGKGVALAVGKTVSEGDTIETKEKSLLELALPDGSKLRLGASTKVTLTEAHFGANKERNVSVSTWVGRVWAKVAKAVGGSDTFEVETRNAVAGVRGTSFAVHAAADLSAVVRVYAGTVGVRKGDGAEAFGNAKTRKQIPGPSQIDKKQWEEIIAGSMKQVKVTAAGEISPAEDFADSGDDVEWAMWNKKRDSAAN
jgi:hypothetical protein